MRRISLLVVLLLAATAFAAEGPVERWAKAAGGRAKLARINSIYREGTVQIAGLEGTIKVWHTAEGKYRKEEQVAMFSSVETFDGKSGLVQRGGGPPKNVEGAELAVALSKAYANSNAIFFVFFPDRHRGTITPDGPDTIVFKPEGGIEWRVTLDAQTSLPKTMVHAEGGKQVEVTFTAYETIDGVELEKEIHRSNGDPRFDAVIRFTKTVINPPMEASLFTIAPH